MGAFDELYVHNHPLSTFSENKHDHTGTNFNPHSIKIAPYKFNALKQVFTNISRYHYIM